MSCGRGAEERDSFSDENGDASDDEALNESGAEESLDCDSAIDVEVVGAGGGELGNDFGGRAGPFCSTVASDGCR